MLGAIYSMQFNTSTFGKTVPSWTCMRSGDAGYASLGPTPTQVLTMLAQLVGIVAVILGAHSKVAACEQHPSRWPMNDALEWKRHDTTSIVMQ